MDDYIERYSNKLKLNKNHIEDAKKKINEIRGDSKHPYNLENHPSHNDAVKEMTRLYSTAYPG